LRKHGNNNAYAAADEITLINNAMMYLFSSIKYELGNQTIETINCPGQTTSMLGYLSYPDDFSKSAGLICCWSKDTNTTADSSKYAASAAAPIAGYIPGVNTYIHTYIHTLKFVSSYTIVQWTLHCHCIE
jgi:hypothetical protein